MACKLGEGTFQTVEAFCERAPNVVQVWRLRHIHSRLGKRMRGGIRGTRHAGGTTFLDTDAAISRPRACVHARVVCTQQAGPDNGIAPARVCACVRAPRVVRTTTRRSRGRKNARTFPGSEWQPERQPRITSLCAIIASWVASSVARRSRQKCFLRCKTNRKNRRLHVES